MLNGKWQTLAVWQLKTEKEIQLSAKYSFKMCFEFSIKAH